MGFNVQIIWLDQQGIIQCSQCPDIIRKTMDNGINVYCLFPMRQIIIWNIFGKFQPAKSIMPSLDQISNPKFKLNCAIVQSKGVFNRIANNIWKAKQDLLDTFDITTVPDINIDEAYNIAKAYANESQRSTSIRPMSEVLYKYQPKPITKYTRRFKKGNTKEEIAFIVKCQAQKEVEYIFKQPIHVMENEIQAEWQDINREKAKGKISKPLDLHFYQWFQAKRNPETNPLDQIQKAVINLNFQPTHTVLQDAVEDREAQIKIDIINALEQLKKLQKEKDQVQNVRNFNVQLINENCFPIIAEIWCSFHAMNGAAGMEIEEILESSIDWSGTWSTVDE